MSLGPNTLKKSVTADRKDIEWLDRQIDIKHNYNSYSHFFQKAIYHFRKVEPRRKRRDMEKRILERVKHGKEEESES